MLINRKYFSIVLFIFFAVTLRLIFLGSQVLWIDELLRLESTSLAYSQLIPVALIKISGNLSLFPFVIRYFSVLVASLSISSLVLLNGGNNKRYVVIVLLFIFSWWHIFFSQDASPYTLVVFFTGLTFYFTWRIIEYNFSRDWAGLLICSIAGFYTHTYVGLHLVGVFLFIIGVFVWQSFRNKSGFGKIRNKWFYLILVCVANGLFFLPTLVSVYTRTKEVSGNSMFDRHTLLPQWSGLRSSFVLDQIHYFSGDRQYLDLIVILLVIGFFALPRLRQLFFYRLLVPLF